MRSSVKNMDVWPFMRAEETSPESTGENGFDSFGPVRTTRRAFEAARPAVRPPHDFTRVLLAEDDAFHRRVLRVLLNSPRISLIEVEDGQAAIDLLALRSFDVVLLDTTMPNMSGKDTLNWIRRSLTPWADIPVLGLIDEKDRDQVGRMMSMGLTDWMSKPVSRRELSEKMVALLPGLADAGL